MRGFHAALKTRDGRLHFSTDHGIVMVNPAQAWTNSLPPAVRFERMVVDGIAPEGVAWMTDIDKYFSFVLTTFVAFGVTFEVPVVVIVLVLTEMVSIAKLKEARPYVIVGAFVVAAVFTPPDVLSQFMLAVPLCLLYELGLFVSGFLGGHPGASNVIAGETQGTGIEPKP